MKHHIISAVCVFGLTACVTPPPPITEGVEVAEIAAVATQCEGTSFDIYFGSGETTLNEAATAVIEKIATSYQPCTVNFLSVEGHSDASGDAATNLIVSEKRALSVVEALVSSGVDADRVRISPLGEQEAVTDDGLLRPQNRKTTVRIVT